MPAALTEVFSTEHGAVYQSDHDNAIWVDFGGQLTSFNISCFLSLKSLVDRIDLDAMAEHTDPAHDVEVISPCQCERCYVLNLQEALHFKELLAGAKVMLELNSILQERLYSKLPV